MEKILLTDIPTKLKANEPYVIDIPEGLDYFNDIIHISYYPKKDVANVLHFIFKTYAGVGYKTSITLGNKHNEIKFQLPLLFEMYKVEPFYSIELLSPEDIDIFIWSQQQITDEQAKKFNMDYEKHNS